MDLQHISLNLIGTSSFDPNNGDKSEHDTVGHASSIEKEHMFDKVVTPSDVGKLNRLVIPKQYAEKYFPFDSFTNEKEGLLLNFEDREGKPWRFRYSYWNSSQSYVMTKGWSGFVKDKKLDAGDVVSFQRGATETSRDRLFIDWQHRPSASSSLRGSLHDGRMLSREQYYRSFGAPQLLYRHVGLQQQLGYSVNNRYMAGGTGRGDPNAVYFRPSTGSVGTAPVRSPVVFRSVPLVRAAKRLRLFGVNMECPIMKDQSNDHDHHQIDLSSALVSKPSNIGDFSQKLPRQQYDDPRPMLSNSSWKSSTMSLDINFQNLR